MDIVLSNSLAYLESDDPMYLRHPTIDTQLGFCLLTVKVSENLHVCVSVVVVVGYKYKL
jgi:hypothetical protein